MVENRNHIVGSRIVRAREGKDMMARDLAQKIGITPSRLSNWENGTNGVNPDYIYAISTALGVTSDYLIGLSEYPDHCSSDVPFEPLLQEILKNASKLNKEGKDKVAVYASDIHGKYSMVNKQGNVPYDVSIIEDSKTLEEFTYRASAGSGAYNDDAEGHICVVSEKDMPKHDAMVQVVGNSMEPTINDNDVAFVVFNCDHMDGKIYVVSIGNETLIKRCYFKSGQLRLVSDNPEWEDRILSDHEMQQARVVGRVIDWTTPLG